MISIMLRKKDYSSIDYYDYLKMGLNKIDISVSESLDKSDPESSDCGFAIRALAIG